MLRCEREVACDRRGDATYELRRGRKLLGEWLRERRVLTERQHAVVAATIARVHALTIGNDRLATIHGCDQRAQLRGQRRFANERELTVEHQADGTARDTPCRGVL